MGDRRIYYRFEIDAYSPETLPMSRLAEYLSDLAILFGNQENVHFVKIDKGSAVPVVAVEYTAAPKVRDRLRLVQAGEAEHDASRAYEDIDRRLAQDNATGLLKESRRKTGIIEFPGRNRLKEEVYGPFNQQSVLDGELIKVGGELNIVPVHIRPLESEKPLICVADRRMVRRIAPHIFGPPLRVYGTARWQRRQDGIWEMLRFKIEKFDVLDAGPLTEVIGKLRAIEGGIAGLEDPLRELHLLRHGEEAG